MKNHRAIMMCLAFISAVSFSACAQAKKSPAATAEGEISGAKITVNYYQPSSRGRTMIGGKNVPYGKVWRTGANNATTIDISQDIKVEGKTLAKGKYALFTIPGEKKWTIIFNSTTDQWGAYDYDDSKDVLRVEVEANKPSSHLETFTISVEKDGVKLAWENSEVMFAVK